VEKGLSPDMEHVEQEDHMTSDRQGEPTMKGMEGGERSTKDYQGLASTPKGPSFRSGT
jgi:hypothetical protein